MFPGTFAPSRRCLSRTRVIYYVYKKICKVLQRRLLFAFVLELEPQNVFHFFPHFEGKPAARTSYIMLYRNKQGYQETRKKKNNHRRVSQNFERLMKPLCQNLYIFVSNVVSAPRLMKMWKVDSFFFGQIRRKTRDGKFINLEITRLCQSFE